MRGIVLVFVSGILTLFALLGSLFAWAGLAANAASVVTDATTRTALAALSGAEYAAARLWRDGRPAELRTVENAPDDWTCRTPPAAGSRSRSRAPSFNHGEPWQDNPFAGMDGLDNDGDTLIDETDETGLGAYTPGESWTDLNGNGRYDAASGRLRGTGAATFFSLQIASSAGRICVNSGELGSPAGDHDVDGIPNDADGGEPDLSGNPVPGSAYVDDADGNGTDDWHDTGFAGNRHLVNLLDNLGAVAGLAATPVLFAPGYPALGSITVSDLGRRIVQARPRGGYGSLDGIRAVVGQADFDIVSRFLAVEGDVVPVALPALTQAADNKYRAYWLLITDPEPRYEFHARIDFNMAPVEVLQASLRHIAASGTHGEADFVGTLRNETPFIRLNRDEADAVANRLAGARPVHSWASFLYVLHGQCSSAFEDDPFTTSVNEKTNAGKIRQKEDLILAQVAPGGYFGDRHTWRLNTLEVEREDPALAPLGIDHTSVRKILKGFLAPPLNTLPYDVNGATSAGIPPAYPSNIPCYMTTEYSLSGIGPAVFRVQSAGWTDAGGESAFDADFSMREGVVHLTGQQHFEQAGTDLSRPWRYPGGDVRVEAPPPSHPSIRSYPRFPLDSYDPDSFPGYPQQWMLDHDRYPRADGGLHLATRHLPHAEMTGDCVFALPANGDKPVPGTWYDSREWRDNMEDPVLTTGRRSPPISNLAPDLLHRGYRAGPCGCRFPRSFYDFLDDRTVTWGAASGIDFPATRNDYDGAGAPLPKAGELKEFTLTAWIPAQGGKEETILNPGIYNPKDIGTITLKTECMKPLNPPAYADYLGLTFNLDGAIKVKDPSVVCDPPWKHAAYANNPDPAVQAELQELKAAGWRFLAVTIRHDASIPMGPDESAVFVHLDGACVNDPPGAPLLIKVKPLGGWTPTSGFQLDFYDAPVDDLRFHDKVLDPATEILWLARQDRYARAGSYTSPRHLFNAGALPEGAHLREVAIDGFVPSQTGGSFTSRVTTYDAAGTPIDTSPGFTWNGSSVPASGFSARRCRQFDIAIDIDTDPQLTIGGVAALRDTPHLRMVSVKYAQRPGWSGFSRR